MKTSEKILEYIKKHDQASGKELSEFLGVTDRAVRKQLKTLLLEKKLKKIGTPPRVYYQISTSENKKATVLFDKKTVGILDNHFYHITPSGEQLVGTDGFVSWCQERDFDVIKKGNEFVKVVTKYQKARRHNLINATHKLKKTFPNNDGADELYYYDFYSVEVFGKTKIGQKLLYAKQSQNKKLMKDIFNTVRPVILQLIKRKNIDAVAYVPPTVKREIQFMKVLEKELMFGLPKVEVNKVVSDISVPQKTLKKLSDRIKNANTSFVVASITPYRNILVIDDAVGSGASINQIAKKIKKRGVARRVIGCAITGSLNDFDVISEV